MSFLLIWDVGHYNINLIKQVITSKLEYLVSNESRVEIFLFELDWLKIEFMFNPKQIHADSLNNQV